MRIRTLAHHSKGGNRYQFEFGGQTITITRRFLPSRSVRVRVTSVTISGKEKDGNWSEYRDFTDMHDGDAEFSRQAQRFCDKWERRYIPTKKETTTVRDTTPESNKTPVTDTDSQPTATQWAAGATMTPAKAAELATRRTGVTHVVADDGKTLCRQEMPEQVEYVVPPGAKPILSRRGKEIVEALDGTFVGKVIGEYTFRVKGNRPSRTGEMGKLLAVTGVVVSEWQMRRHALNSQALTGDPATDQAREDELSLMEHQAVYFKHLLDAGYADDTTWDELVVMLQPLVDTARRALPDHRAALEVLSKDGQAVVRRMITGAEAFLMATRGVRKFYEDDTDDDSE